MSERSGEHGGERGLERAAALLDVRPPAEELRRLARARMETLARLGRADAEGAPAGAAGSSAAPRDRLEVYPRALEHALERLREEAG